MAAAAVREPLVDIDPPPRYAWDSTLVASGTQTARIEDAKQAQAKADDALAAIVHGEAQRALDAAAAEARAADEEEAKWQRLLARQRRLQAAARGGDSDGVASVAARPWDNVRVRSSLERKDRAAARARAASHDTRRAARVSSADSSGQSPAMFRRRQSKEQIVDELAREIEARVRPEATVEWALRAALPTAEQWRPPRSFITKEGTDGGPFVWISARKASAAPAMYGKQSLRASMSAEEKRDKREKGVTMARHRACMEELLKLKRGAERQLHWAETMAPFAVADKTIESQQVTKDRRRAFGDDEGNHRHSGPVAMEKDKEKESTRVDAVVVASASSVVVAAGEGDSARGGAADVSLTDRSVAATPFAMEGGAAALEARARMDAARRMRQRNRHVGRESWQKYAELGDADVDARGRRVVVAKSAEEPESSAADGSTAASAAADAAAGLSGGGQAGAAATRVDGAGTGAGTTGTGTGAGAGGGDLWQQRQTSSMLFQRRGGVYYAQEEEATTQPSTTPTPAADEAAAADDNANDEDEDGEEDAAAEGDLSGLYALAPERIASEVWADEMNHMRNILDDITEMARQNIMAAERHSSSEAPRMKLAVTPRAEREQHQQQQQSIKQQPRESGGVWNHEPIHVPPRPPHARQHEKTTTGRQHQQQHQHRLRSAQRVRTPREKQLLASRAAASMAEVAGRGNTFQRYNPGLFGVHDDEMDSGY